LTLPKKYGIISQRKLFALQIVFMTKKSTVQTEQATDGFEKPFVKTIPHYA
jgi:hypothetical protein